MGLKWNPVKNERLKKVRGASFEEIIGSKFIAGRKHPKHPDQYIFLFEYKGYIWVTPFVRDGMDLFLKTLYPSRKYTKLFWKGEL